MQLVIFCCSYIIFLLFQENFTKVKDKSQSEGAAKPDHIYMDHMGFGMGCCCLQVTFQVTPLFFNSLKDLLIGKENFICISCLFLLIFIKMKAY